MWACHLNSFCHSWKEMGTCKIWGTRPASAACSTGGWMVPESANVSSPITKQMWQLATLALPCQLSEVLLHPLVAVFNYLVFANIPTGIHTPSSSFPLSRVCVLFSMVDQAQAVPQSSSVPQRLPEGQQHNLTLMGVRWELSAADGTVWGAAAQHYGFFFCSRTVHGSCAWQLRFLGQAQKMTQQINKTTSTVGC